MANYPNDIFTSPHPLIASFTQKLMKCSVHPNYPEKSQMLRDSKFELEGEPLIMRNKWTKTRRRLSALRFHLNGKSGTTGYFDLTFVGITIDNVIVTISMVLFELKRE